MVNHTGKQRTLETRNPRGVQLQILVLRTGLDKKAFAKAAGINNSRFSTMLNSAPNINLSSAFKIQHALAQHGVSATIEEIFCDWFEENGDIRGTKNERPAD